MSLITTNHIPLTFGCALRTLACMDSERHERLYRAYSLDPSPGNRAMVEMAAVLAQRSSLRWFVCECEHCGPVDPDAGF
jgi:hypothetical protein